MDEEASFANLLSARVAPSRPSWDNVNPSGTDAHDPWANPFSDHAHSNPFASTSATTGPFGSSSTYDTPYSSDLANFSVPPSAAATLDSPRDEISPYVQRLEQDRDEGVGKLPDPPSVIAAREIERADSGFAGGFGAAGSGAGSGGGIYASSAFATPMPSTPAEVDPFNANPFAPPGITPLADPANAPFVPLPSQQPVPTESQSNPRKLPSALIDEDLMAASDPEISLKKAFVKSSSPARPAHERTSSANLTPSKDIKKYVFTPKKVPQVSTQKDVKGEEAKQASEYENGKKLKSADAAKQQIQAIENKEEPVKDAKADGANGRSAQTGPTSTEPDIAVSSPSPEDPAASSLDAATPTAPRSPSSVPLPVSAAPTPAISRQSTPAPVKADVAEPAISQLATPSFDRVSVSPLDPPSASSENTDYGFKFLSIGGSSIQPPPVPAKESWGGDQTRVTSPPASRFGGKGWGDVDDDDGGLFGPGGPSTRSDPWGNDVSTDAGGWGDPGLDSVHSSAGPSRYSDVNGSTATSPRDDESEVGASTFTNGAESVLSSGDGPLTPSRKSKLLSTPVFRITVGDPARVGDAVRGYTVYTVKTKTTSPHYRKADFSVLRRFSDFLWLFEVLTANNPGVIVPPVPDKHAFGRFQDQFIETRRLALQRCLAKITSHPVLQLDPDLRLFLESDNFTIESKNRKQEAPPPPTEKGLLGGWTGPKYVEQDDWFDSRRAFLDSLESQLKALSKSIETASKARLDAAQSIHDFAETITALAESDLGTSLSSSLAQLSNLATKEQECYEEQAKSDVVYLLNMADEYVRFIGSVRAAFGGRVKAWITWQSVEKDVVRLKSHREKWKAQGKLGERAASSLAEINETERRARDLSNEFDSLSKLIKSEFVRFERERVEEFKRVLEEYLDGMIARQKGLIDGWEEYHKSILGIVQRSQGQAQ